MKNKIMPTAVLAAICLMVALVLALINSVTVPIIAEAQENAAREALLKVYPNGTDFKEIDISEHSLPKSVTAVYSEGSGGFVIQTTVKGYNSGLIIMCGINNDGEIVGCDFIASKETLSAEIGLGDRFLNKSENEMTPELVAGSTAKLTTGAYYNAILDSFTAFNILKSSSELYTPDQSLSNDLITVLGTEGGNQ